MVSYFNLESRLATGWPMIFRTKKQGQDCFAERQLDSNNSAVPRLTALPLDGYECSIVLDVL